LICTNLTQCNQFLEVALGDTNAGALAAIALARFPPTDVTLNKLLQKVREGDRTVGIEWALKEIGDPAVEALKLLRTNTNIRTETDSSGSIQTNGAQHIENALKVLSEANAEIEVRDLNGTRQRILANQRNVVIAVATWCPHSLAFVQLLSDSAIQKLLPERTFTFVFSDEWPRFEQMLDGEVRAGVKTQAQARQALSERRLQSGHPLVTDPEFLNLLPGRAVFSAGDKGEPAADSYPMVFDPARKRYTQTAANWALRGVWLPDFIRQQVRW